MGFWELLAILVIVLLFFGARRLPAIGEGLGKGIRAFRDSSRSEPTSPARAKKEPPSKGGSEG